MLDPATEETKAYVCECLNTTVEQLEKDVETLKSWIKTQPHLPQISSNTMLTTYLVACKNRMDRAQEKIENYYTMRAKKPDLFTDRDPLNERIQDCSKEIVLITMPKRTPDRCRISFSSFVTGDSKKYDMWAYTKWIWMVEDIRMNQDPFHRGVYFIFDASNFSMAHALKVSPSLARHLIVSAQEVLPAVIKGLIFINAPTYLEIALRIVKPLMKKKLIERFHVHTEGPEILEKYFPIALMPKDYGGEEDSSIVLNEAWMKYILTHRDWLMNEGSIPADEEKRIKANKKNKKDDNDNKDVDDSFRSLCID